MKVKLGLLLFGLVLMAGGLLAQDMTLPEFACLPIDYQTAKTDLDALTAQLVDPEQDVALTLLLLDAYTETLRARCTGGTFNKVSHPNGIVGPVVLGGTLYQMDFTSQAQVASVVITPISGDCGFPQGALLTEPGSSETNILKFGEDCVLLFEVNSQQADWQLVFARLS